MLTFYILFAVLLIAGVSLGIYAYRIYREDKRLGIKEFRKKEKQNNNFS